MKGTAHAGGKSALPLHYRKLDWDAFERDHRRPTSGPRRFIAGRPSACMRCRTRAFSRP